MSIQVKFFASLADELGKESAQCAAIPTMTARAVWASVVDSAPAEQIKVAVNQRYTGWEAPVKDGDEVAFFPPVTGG